MFLVSKVETFAKLFFIVSLSGLLMYIVLAFHTFHTAYTTITQTRRTQEKIRKLPDPDTQTRFHNDLKYILLWTVSNQSDNPFGIGQEPFISHQCSHMNCFLTTDKELLDGDYTNFDAVILNVSILTRGKKDMLPQRRNERQKYIFYSKLPSEDYPVCASFADHFFNWTWSYKLYSDIFSPFFEIKDDHGNVIAPRPEVDWMAQGFQVKEVTPRKKTKHLAMIMNESKCDTKLNKTLFVKHLQDKMKEEKLIFDIYGCGNLPCPKGICLKAIKSDYYFYLVHEDTLCEDYLTAEILKAYKYDAVPIVVSGADLSKFLPPNSYVTIDASSTFTKLAAIIDYSVRNPAVFSRFNRWKSYYSVHEVESTRGLCDLCKNLNNAELMKTRSSYEFFRKWWYQGYLQDKCVPNVKKPDEKELTSYYNDSRGR